MNTTFQYQFGGVTTGTQANHVEWTSLDIDSPVRDKRLEDMAVFVAVFWRRKRYGPTLREIQSELHIASLGTIRSDIDHLVRAGWVDYTPYQSRTLVPTDKLLSLV